MKTWQILLTCGMLAGCASTQIKPVKDNYVTAKIEYLKGPWENIKLQGYVTELVGDHGRFNFKLKNESDSLTCLIDIGQENQKQIQVDAIDGLFDDMEKSRKIDVYGDYDGKFFHVEGLGYKKGKTTLYVDLRCKE